MTRVSYFGNFVLEWRGKLYELLPLPPTGLSCSAHLGTCQSRCYNLYVSPRRLENPTAFLHQHKHGTPSFAFLLCIKILLFHLSLLLENIREAPSSLKGGTAECCFRRLVWSWGDKALWKNLNLRPLWVSLKGTTPQDA